MVQTEAEGFYVTQDVKGDAASQQPEKNNREFDGSRSFTMVNPEERATQRHVITLGFSLCL